MLKISLGIFLTFNFVLMQCNNAKKSEQPIEMSTSQLISDYEKNEPFANDKYEGQNVFLTGKVSHYAVLNETAGVYFRSTDNTIQRMIVCLIDLKTNSKDYSTIKSETNAKFAGVVKSDSSDSVIFINDCHLVE